MPGGVGGPSAHQQCADHTSRGGAQPTRMLITCNGPRRSEGPQGATPRTRSAGSTPTWTAGLSCKAAEDFSSCNAPPEGRPLRVTPQKGASQRLCRRPALPSTLGFLYRDAERYWAPPRHPGTQHRHPSPLWQATAVVAPGGPVNSGSGQVGVHDTSLAASMSKAAEPRPSIKRIFEEDERLP